MRTLLIAAAAAGLMTLSVAPVAASANAPQERRYEQDHNRPVAGRPNDPRANDHRPGANRPDDHNRPGADRDDSRYGQWNPSWGARPSAPPRAYASRQNDWYRHVRACSTRYRSYNPRTDTYVVRRNVTARCRL